MVLPTASSHVLLLISSFSNLFMSVAVKENASYPTLKCVGWVDAFNSSGFARGGSSSTDRASSKMKARPRYSQLHTSSRLVSWRRSWPIHLPGRALITRGGRKSRIFRIPPFSRRFSANVPAILPQVLGTRQVLWAWI